MNEVNNYMFFGEDRTGTGDFVIFSTAALERVQEGGLTIEHY